MSGTWTFTSMHCPACRQPATDDIIAPCDNKFCPTGKPGDHLHHWCPPCARFHHVVDHRDITAAAAPTPVAGQLGLFA